MATPLIRRARWPLAAAVAVAFLAILALHGERPDSALAPFKAAGPLTAFAPEQAREVDIAKAGDTWHFRREAGTWQAVHAPRPVPADASDRIDTALRLLRDSRPLRVLSPDEVSRTTAADYALGADALSVTVHAAGGATFAIRFGALNPLGSATYARVEGAEEVPLLPAYVAGTWEQAIGATR